MSRELKALENIVGLITWYDKSGWPEKNQRAVYKEDIDIIETALKRNIELEQRNLILTNFKTTSMINKKPLSNLFCGLSQEERYKYIEHIYYTYSEVKEELDYLKLAYQKVVSDSKAKDEKLQALDVIKEILEKDDDTDYVDILLNGLYSISKTDEECIEKYNLLKEVLL